jgi:hypothetical protein
MADYFKPQEALCVERRAPPKRARNYGGSSPGWLDEDIGSVGVVGNAQYASNVFTVQGGGRSFLGNSADGFSPRVRAVVGTRNDDGTPGQCEQLCASWK